MNVMQATGALKHCLKPWIFTFDWKATGGSTIYSGKYKTSRTIMATTCYGVPEHFTTNCKRLRGPAPANKSSRYGARETF